MEPSKRYSFISLLFILKCLLKTLVIKIELLKEKKKKRNKKLREKCFGG